MQGDQTNPTGPAPDPQAQADPPLAPLLYALEERPPWPQALLVAGAHLMAIAGGIASAPLLIARGLNLDGDTTAYLISSALLVSGLATIVQICRVGPVGSGLLCIQGTSFSFIGILLYAGALVDRPGITDQELIGVLLGSAAVGAAGTVVMGYFIAHLRRVITVNVTAVAIFLLGLTLVGASFNGLRMASASDGLVVWGHAALVVTCILLISSARNPWLRLSSISVGLAISLLVALATGTTAAPAEASGEILWPRLLPFPLGFELGVALLLVPIFVVTVAESLGDLTATSLLSRQPLAGPAYWRRIRGGIMADGLNSVLAALLGTFPNTTFSQNNGVIRLTGVASRFVGLLVAVMLILLGLLPFFVGLIQMLPQGTIHGLTLVLFAMISLAGLRIVRTQSDPAPGMRLLVWCSVSAFALSFVPSLAAMGGLPLPDYLALLLGFPVATGTVLAILIEGFRSL